MCEVEIITIVLLYIILYIIADNPLYIFTILKKQPT